MVIAVFVENGGHGNLAAAPLAKALFEKRFGAPPPAVTAAPGLVRASNAQTGKPAMISRVLSARSRFDPIVLGSALLLSALGILFVASATAGGKLAGLAARQGLWVAVGLGLMLAAILFDYRTLLKVSFPIYCATLVPLLYLLFFGERIANVRSWIRIGGFQFQPAELAKIATALLLAYLFENEDDGRLRGTAFFKLGAIVGVPFLLVFLQPDLGLALTFLPLLGVGLYFGGLPARGWIVLILLVAVVCGAAWFLLKDYQKQRIGTFLNPEQDVLGAGYQVRQSKIAVGSGGFFGKGFRSGTQSQLRFLPVQHTDFILAVIAEEWGFLGVILVLGLFAALLLRALTLAQAARDRGGVFLDAGARRHDLLLGRHQRLDDDRPAPDDRHSVAARLLRRVFRRHDLSRDRPDPRRRIPPVRQRVSKELFVNATPPETRVALREDGRTVEVFHERRGRESLVGNVYLGRVHRVLPGMQAAFVAIGFERDAFLYVEDASPHPVDFEGAEEDDRNGAAGARRPAAHRRPRQGRPATRRPGDQGPDRRKGSARHGGRLAARAHARLPAFRRRGRHLAPHHRRNRARAAAADPRGVLGRGRLHRAHGGAGRVRGGARGGPRVSCGARGEDRGTG